MTHRGLFISFEGIDGSGKSTQARMLAEHLKSNGHDVLLTREPGGSPGAEEIRALLLTGDQDRWSAHSELLLFTAARRDHLEKTINPALKQGQMVITDRFADSTRVYQGVGRDNLRAQVDALHDLMIAQDPDITILIDLDPAEGLKRATDRGGDEARFESFGLELQTALRSGFLDLAAKATGRIHVIDGAHSPNDVHAKVLDAIGSRL